MRHKNTLTCLLLIIGLALTNSSILKAYDITVAQDGSGNYQKVQDAFNAVPDNNPTTTTIFIKNGTYKEKLKLESSKKKVKLIGESRDNTILTYDDHANIAGGTNSSYSTWIEADDFYAENVTFQNTIDSRVNGSQAVALMVTGDRAIFYNCRITGFQDTYYLKSNTRSYTKNCIIEGTTDFIFGAGIALIEDCTIKNRKNSHVTAHSQKLVNGNPVNKYGFVFKNCEIIEHPQETVTSASLGRPWGNAARVVYLNCYEGDHIKSDGWAEWSSGDNHLTAYYAEYNCSGPGYQPSKRLSWTHQLSDSEAAIYTKEQIFKANTTTALSLLGDWNPVIDGSSGSSPSVSITSPTNGSSYIAPANITISANASDSDGSVSKVEFFQGSTPLGTDNSAPYSVTWSNVSVGNYSLTAVATDNDGASTTSSTVNITVNQEGAVSIIIQENETGFDSYDGTIDTENTGFTGDGYVNTDNASGKGINWEICVPENGVYTLAWRYANGGTDDRAAEIKVDGSIKISNVSFPATSSWTSWGNSPSVNVSLASGTHQIRLEATNASGLSNIDHISIAGKNPQAGSCSNNIAATGVSVSPTSASVSIGATKQLTATISPSNATNKNMSWASAKTSIATVSPTGLVIGVAEGSTTITVTTADGGFAATCNISVTGTTSGGCDSPVAISLPFTQEGAGEYCWKTSGDISYISSWGLEKLEINGVDYTNTWLSELPAKQDGYYTFHYVGKETWSHLEIASMKSAKESIAEKATDLNISLYPNPVNEQLNIQFGRDITEFVDIQLLDLSGKAVKIVKANGTAYILDMSGVAKGAYIIRISGENMNIQKHVVKQ